MSFRCYLLSYLSNGWGFAWVFWKCIGCIHNQWSWVQTTFKLKKKIGETKSNKTANTLLVNNNGANLLQYFPKSTKCDCLNWCILNSPMSWWSSWENHNSRVWRNSQLLDVLELETPFGSLKESDCSSNFCWLIS